MTEKRKTYFDRYMKMLGDDSPVNEVLYIASSNVNDIKEHIKNKIPSSEEDSILNDNETFIEDEMNKLKNISKTIYKDIQKTLPDDEIVVEYSMRIFPYDTPFNEFARTFQTMDGFIGFIDDRTILV